MLSIQFKVMKNNQTFYAQLKCPAAKIDQFKMIFSKPVDMGDFSLEFYGVISQTGESVYWPGGRAPIDILDLFETPSEVLSPLAA